MGFLDHSTNNIIVDAVLTDTGRKLLAQNDGSFVVSHFAFGDDEVDYSIIKKFGRTVGKEKITKNTPVFEGQTNGDLGIKYRLLSVSTPDLTYLPTMKVIAGGDATIVRKSGDTTSNLTVEQGIPSGQTVVPADLQDTRFIVEYDTRFLTVTRTTAGGVTTPNISNNIATVNVTPTDVVSTSGAQRVSLNISPVSFPDEYYDTYTFSGAGTSAIIRTQVKVTGRSSGASVVLTYDLQKS